MKKNMQVKAWLVLLCLSFSLIKANAQTEIITFPVNGTVFQKEPPFILKFTEPLA